MKKLASILIIGVFLLTGCSNIDDLKTKEDEVVDKTPVVEENNEPTKEVNKEDDKKEASNKDKEDTNNEEILIEKAIQTLYSKTGENIDEVTFVHNQNESYVKEASIKEQYYIFNIVHNINTEYEIIRDYNILVDKDTYEVYLYIPGTGLEPYSMEDEEISEEMLIEKAIQTLYSKTGESNDEVTFVHNQNESYVQEDSIKEQYYIFNIVRDINTEYETISDSNILVDKDTYEVYLYLPESGLQPY